MLPSRTKSKTNRGSIVWLILIVPSYDTEEKIFFVCDRTRPEEVSFRKHHHHHNAVVVVVVVVVVGVEK